MKPSESDESHFWVLLVTISHFCSSAHVPFFRGLYASVLDNFKSHMLRMAKSRVENKPMAWVPDSVLGSYYDSSPADPLRQLGERNKPCHEKSITRQALLTTIIYWVL